jgi:hypothetical protein
MAIRQIERDARRAHAHEDSERSTAVDQDPSTAVSTDESLSHVFNAEFRDKFVPGCVPDMSI